MKKFAWVVFSLTLPVSVFSQTYPIDQGSIIAGGSANFSSLGSDANGDERTTIIFINPSLDLFVIPHLAFGGAVSFANVSQGEISNSTIGIGPSLAYFWGGPKNKIYPFLRGSYFFNRDASDFTSNTLRFSGGAAVMLAKNVAIIGNAFYSTENFKREGEDDAINNDTFGVAFGIGVFVF